jgi:hypothetical protein
MADFLPGFVNVQITTNITILHQNGDHFASFDNKDQLMEWLRSYKPVLRPQLVLFWKRGYQPTGAEIDILYQIGRVEVAACEV